MIITGTMLEIKRALTAMHEGMKYDYDIFSCEPGCRLSKDDINYGNCNHCIADYLKNIELRDTSWRGGYHDSDGILKWRDYKIIELNDFIDTL